MLSQQDLEFYCPRCHKPASENLAFITRKYSVQLLNAPYFLCGECRLIFVSWKLIRKFVSQWRNGNPELRKTPFKFFYDEVVKYLNTAIVPYYTRIGYELTRFKKQKPRSRNAE